MNKLAAIAASLVFALAAFTAVGCAVQQTPTDVTRASLDAIKAQDFDTLQKYYASDAKQLDVTEMAGGASGMDLSSLSDEEKTMVEQFVKVMTDFDYELGAETINGDTATVEVTITAHDLGKAFSESITELFAQALSDAFSGSAFDQKAMIGQFVESFSAKVDAQKEKTHVATTTFNLVKGEDGTWKLDKLTEENLDCLMGGMITGVQDTLGSLNSLGSAA